MQNKLFDWTITISREIIKALGYFLALMIAVALLNTVFRPLTVGYVLGAIFTAAALILSLNKHIFSQLDRLNSLTKKEKTE